MSRLGTDVGDVNELRVFQSKLRKLSEELRCIYTFLKSDLRNLSCEWKDNKFIEFDRNFGPKKEEIRKNSEKYLAWADGPIQKTIERLEDVRSTIFMG